MWNCSKNAIVITPNNINRNRQLRGRRVATKRVKCEMLSGCMIEEADSARLVPQTIGMKGNRMIGKVIRCQPHKKWSAQGSGAGMAEG